MYNRPYSTSTPQYNRSKIMAQNITRNIPGTSFSSKAAKYRAMAASASPATSTIAPQQQQSIAGTMGVAYSTASTSLSQRSLYNTRAQLRTQRLIEEQKRLEEERIKQLVSVTRYWSTLVC